MTKKGFIKKIIKVFAITMIIMFFLLIVAPFIAIPFFVNRHVDYWGYSNANYPMKDIYQASDYGLIEDQMNLETEDGFNVWISEIYTERPKAVIIYLTGIIQPSVTYFYGHAKYMKENGYASILLEVRGHGNSDGNQICLGYEETNDVKTVVEYIKSEEKYNGVPIVLQGVSMGGTIAVNAFGQDEDIDVLIAMSVYSSFEEVSMDIADKYGVPKFIQVFEKPLIQTALKMVFGSNAVNHIKPIEQIHNTKGRPVMLIACSDDAEVPSVSTQRLKKANPEVQMWIRDSWEHFIVQNCDFVNVEQDKEYCSRILNFIEKQCGRLRTSQQYDKMIGFSGS